MNETPDNEAPESADPPEAAAAPAAEDSTAPAAEQTAQQTVEQVLGSVHTSNFPDILRELNACVLVSTYQAGKLVILRPDGNSINTHFRTFNRPMGMAADRQRLMLGAMMEIAEFRNMPDVAKRLHDPPVHDAVYMARRGHITGHIDIHEMAWDGDGAIWFINTLFSSFGSGICTEKTGIVLTNRGACFTLEEGHANVFAAGKRPMHTIIPAAAFRNGRCEMTFGVMGAHYQPMGHVQLILNMLDYGMDVQQAIDCPRFFFEGETVEVESGTPQATIEGLRARGHKVGHADQPWGGAQVIRIDRARGVLIAGSEPRKDGCALGY